MPKKRSSASRPARRRPTPMSPARPIYSSWSDNPRVTVITAAMCQGNKLEAVRDAFPQRFFDVGICESHAVAFAAGQAKAGLRPIVDIYSTFLQRSYDQLFQEVALQNLPVTFLLDRAGLTGPDGPTHHGCFDLGYLRVFPNMLVLAPGDAVDLPRCSNLQFLSPDRWRFAIPKAVAEDVGQLFERDRTPLELAPCRSVRLGPRRHDSVRRHATFQLPQGRRACCAKRDWISAWRTCVSSNRWIPRRFVKRSKPARSW